MANFPPFRDYLFYCLDKIIKQYELKPPFLDVGCGEGEFSRFLAARGWHGKAIDSSEPAMEEASRKLLGYPLIVAERRDLQFENGKYRSVFLLDILEHIESDREVLNKIRGLLDDAGNVVLAVPSNPERWGWDDDFYGHVRRYTAADITKKLSDAGFEVMKIWDFTYPFFTFLRWLNLKTAKKPAKSQGSAAERTEHSGMAPEWQQSFGSRLLTSLGVLWRPVYWIMFSFFKSCVWQGHEMIVLARPVR